STTAVTFSEATLFESSGGAQRTAPLTGSRPTPGTKTGATRVISKFFADRTSVELKRTLTPVSPRANIFNKPFIKSNLKTYCFNVLL
ncbi:hypothetical protein IscW_ISCW024896, partial [Ixodes scapularis]